MLSTTSVPSFGADHMTKINHIYSRLTIIQSLSYFDFQRQHTHTHTHTHSLSYILTSRDSLALPASDTRKMGAYILFDLVLSCSAFSAGLVPVSCTAAGISSNPERDNRPTWEKTRLPKIYL